MERPAAGSSGSSPRSHSVDQIPLYDGLTPLFDNVTAADLPKYYKPNIFGLGGQQPQSVTTPPGRPGLRIERDSFGVPHVFADSRADIMFGAGYVASQDRRVLMELLRGPGRLAALDAPGVDPFGAATSFRTFQPTAQTEAFLQQQVTLLENAGPKGQQALTDIDNYVAGINAAGGGPAWTERDVLAVASLIGAVFGRGGGDEARRAAMLDALQTRLGDNTGNDVWNDLREIKDPETSVSIDRKFPYEGHPGLEKHREGNVVIDDGSLQPVAPGAFAASSNAALSSNALLVGANRSQIGRPLFVAGPQVGYFYPQILMEMDLHGGGIDARGAVFPGSGPYVLLGRGQDYSWSATSSSSDVIDQYVEELCGSDTSYRFNGQCVQMTNFDAGLFGAGGGQPAQQIRFRETVHGPVIGYATVDGRRVAISSKRSTRKREGINAIAFADLNANAVDSAQSFIGVMSQIEFTFNWSYVDNKNIALFSSGRLPIRPKKLDPGLPTLGTGQFEWQGFLSPGAHPQTIDPRQQRDRELEQQTGTRFLRCGRQLELWLHSPQSAARGRGRKERQAHPRVAGRCDEPRSHAGPEGHARPPGDRCRPQDRSRTEPTRRADAGVARELAGSGRKSSRPGTRRQDRRSGCRDPRRSLESNRGRGDEPGSGTAARRPRPPHDEGRSRPAARARPTGPAGTATWTRTCGRCSEAA